MKRQALSEDLRQLILDELISVGAYITLGTIPRGVKSATVDKFKIDKKCVMCLWSNFLEHSSVKSHKSNAGRPQKLDDQQNVEA